MESYEQAYNNNLKYELKNDFYNYQETNAKTQKTDETNYRLKIDDSTNLTTPFSVKDILNINQNYYERNDMWKNGRENRVGDFEPVYHQNQYCPDYVTQVYHNIPGHNMEYWNTEVYEHKGDEYYNYNQYYHNFYPHEYQEVPTISHTGESSKHDSVERNPPSVMPLAPVSDKIQQPIIQNFNNYPKTDVLENFNAISRKTSKVSVYLRICTF